MGIFFWQWVTESGKIFSLWLSILAMQFCKFAYKEEFWNAFVDLEVEHSVLRKHTENVVNSFCCATESIHQGKSFEWPTMSDKVVGNVRHTVEVYPRTSMQRLTTLQNY